jgi:hypothetical protein
MRTRLQPLLAELHAHTTWSDGKLTMRELVDLVGGRSFDVLCVTDHVVRSDDPWLDESQRLKQGVARGEHANYVAEIAREAERARSLYDLLVVPGLELTYNDRDPLVAAHAVALGLRDFVSVDDGPRRSNRHGRQGRRRDHRGASVSLRKLGIRSRGSRAREHP